MHGVFGYDLGKFILDAAGIVVFGVVSEVIYLGEKPFAIACLITVAIPIIAGFQDHDLVMTRRNNILPFGDELFVEFFALAKSDEFKFDVFIRFFT